MLRARQRVVASESGLMEEFMKASGTVACKTGGPESLLQVEESTSESIGTAKSMAMARTPGQMAESTSESIGTANRMAMARKPGQVAKMYNGQFA